MAKYDDASWHYEGDYPEDLKQEDAAIHIGMYLTWCIDNDLMSELQMKDLASEIEAVKSRKMTGAEFLRNKCDEKFSDEDLNETGNDFTAAYYHDDAEFAKAAAPYLQDYCGVFLEKATAEGREFESAYHVEDTWENYELMKVVIDQRFQEWKAYVEAQKN